MRHPFFHGLAPTLHISHRGGAAVAPENTLAAFDRAVKHYRTQVLELDLQVTRDGELVVAHDPTLNRCTDAQGPIAALTLAELSGVDAGYRFTLDGVTFPFRGKGERVPTFREVLRRYPDLRLNVELKPESAGCAALFAQVVRDEGAVNRICCGSEDDAVAARLHAALPEACHFFPRGALAELFHSLRGGAPRFDDRFLVLDIPLMHEGSRLFDPRLRELAAGAGRWVNVWTVNDPEEMRRLIDDQVGGIMTDRPDLLRRALDARR